MKNFNGWGRSWKNDDGRVNLSVTTTDLSAASVRMFQVDILSSSVDSTYTEISVSAGSFETLEQWITTLQTALAEIRQKAISAE